LDALLPVHRAGAEVLVVDNAPSDNRTRRLMDDYPFGYALEPRPGQNWARARGAMLATGQIVAYTDDDAVADPGWLDGLLRPFADPAIAAASGLVMPSELDTPAQALFEEHARFGRGFAPRIFSLQTLHPAAAANAGTGANMAFRRALVLRHGLFTVELDGGTAARSGGDTYAFYRLLSLGHRVAYVPEALVWHRHRRTLPELRATLYGYSLGTLVCWLRCLIDHGETEVLGACAWWLTHHHLPNVWRALRRRPGALPLSLALAEWQGCLAAPSAYLATRRAERGRPAPAQT
jgi:glycosyltransferase involved in cell wall biosynthesis